MQWYEYLVSALPAIIATLTSSGVGIFVMRTIKDFIKDAKEDKKLKELLDANAALITENRLLRQDVKRLNESICKVRERQENNEKE